MSIINIIVGGVTYLLLMLLLGAYVEKRIRVTVLVITPPLTYYVSFLAGLSAFAPSVATGHLIGLIIGLLIYWSVDKQVKAERAKS